MQYTSISGRHLFPPLTPSTLNGNSVYVLAANRNAGSMVALRQMVVFADSYADTGRMFNAPASHQYEEYGIGPMPWKQLYAAPDIDVRVLA